MPSQIPQALEPDQLDVIVGKGNVDSPPGRSFLGSNWVEAASRPAACLGMANQTGGKQEKFSRSENPVL